MPKNTYTDLQTLALDVAKDAGELALRFASDRAALGVEKKGVQDLVTRADRAVEDLVRDRLLAGAPGSAVLAEERGGDPRSDGLLWVVDPIDGTSNYVHGIPHWCVSIALCDEGDVQVGVVHDPVLGETFSAVAGQGARLNGEPVRVSETVRLDEAVLAYGESGRTTLDEVFAALRALRDVDVDLRKQGAAALSAAWVACGRVDGFFELHLNPWDALAAHRIVREAGGRANDFLAGGGLAKGSPLLLATPALYEQLAGLIGVDA
jgi:myo-inositol-1(or 4)-monophosphatase